MTNRILFVDDEPNVLAGIERMLRKEFTVVTAVGPEAGLAALAERGPFAVIVADMRMPKLSGVEFLQRAQQAAPASVRMMLTGNADQQTAINAINEGQIFRFLNKPCSAENLARALKAGLEQHRLIMAEKELLEQTLHGSVKVLTEVLGLVNPTAFGRTTRLQRLVKALGEALKAEPGWQIDLAALLSQLGCVTIPEDVFLKANHVAQMTPGEEAMVNAHPRIAGDLLRKIPRLEAVADAIAYQNINYDGSGAPAGAPRREAIPLAARLLKVAIDFDHAELHFASRPLALRWLDEHAKRYDPVVLQALKTWALEERMGKPRAVEIEQLRERMVVAQDVATISGQLLIRRGQEITSTMLQRLRNFAASGIVLGPIQVIPGVEDAA